MKARFLILISFLFFACETVQNDTDEVCTSDCTRIQGRIYTSDNLPLKNVQIVLEHVSYPESNLTHYRKIGKVKTDSQGNYAMDVFIEDEELGESGGHFELYVKPSTLRSDLLYQDFNLNTGIPQIDDRNVVITRNVFYGKKKNITIQLQNFVPLAAGDQFQIQILFPVGFDHEQPNPDGTMHSYQNSGINTYMASNVSSQFTVQVASGELNYIKVVRTKNGVYSDETIPIVFDSTAPATLTYQY